MLVGTVFGHKLVNDEDRDSGNYQGIVEFSAEASESFYFWESPPTVFHSAFMN